MKRAQRVEQRLQRYLQMDFEGLYSQSWKSLTGQKLGWRLLLLLLLLPRRRQQRPKDWLACLAGPIDQRRSTFQMQRPVLLSQKYLIQKLLRHLA